MFTLMRIETFQWNWFQILRVEIKLGMFKKKEETLLGVLVIPYSTTKGDIFQGGSNAT